MQQRSPPAVVRFTRGHRRARSSADATRATAAYVFTPARTDTFGSALMLASQLGGRSLPPLEATTTQVSPSFRYVRAFVRS